MDSEYVILSSRIASLFQVSFAVFAVSWLLRYTNGPGHIFQRLRELAGVEYYEVYDSDGRLIDIVEEVPDKQLAELFGCFWCLSVWVALFLLMVMVNDLTPREFVNLWISSIGIAGFMHEFVGM